MMRLTLAGDLQGVYIGCTNDPYRSTRPKPSATSLIPLVEVDLYFVEFGLTYNKMNSKYSLYFKLKLSQLSLNLVYVLIYF
jgi:hypothetical protein